METDFIIDDQGSLVCFMPVSQAAMDWMAENVQAESWQWMGNRLCMDPRTAQQLLDGIQAEGFTARE